MNSGEIRHNADSRAFLLGFLLGNTSGMGDTMTGDGLDEWRSVGVNALQKNIREMQLHVDILPPSIGNLGANASAILAKMVEHYGDTPKQFFTLGLSLALLPIRYQQGGEAAEHELATQQLASECGIRELIEPLVPKAKGDASTYTMAVSEVIKLVADRWNDTTSSADQTTDKSAVGTHSVPATKSAASELSDELAKVRTSIRNGFGQEWYFSDIDNDLREISSCMEAKCYRAALSLAGRTLELVLKLYCQNNNIVFDDNWMVGKIFDTLNASSVYVDPGLKNIWNLINQQRIIGVHHKPSVPIPSRDQAKLVCHALLDVLKRVFRLAE